LLMLCVARCTIPCAAHLVAVVQSHAGHKVVTVVLAGGYANPEVVLLLVQGDNRALAEVHDLDVVISSLAMPAHGKLPGWHENAPEVWPLLDTTLCTISLVLESSQADRHHGKIPRYGVPRLPSITTPRADMRDANDTYSPKLARRAGLMALKQTLACIALAVML